MNTRITQSGLRRSWLRSFVISAALLLFAETATQAQDLKITSGTTVKVSGNTALVVQGTLTNGGSFVPGTPSTTTFSNTGAEATSGAITFDNLTKTGGGDLTLSDAITVNGTLTLSDGNIILGSNNLTLGAAATIAGTPSASAMLVADGSGEARKVFTADGSFTFPIGDATSTAEYSPATLSFSSGTYSSAYAGVRVVNAKHSQNNSTTNYLNRYWTISSSGISGYSCTVTGTYTTADVQGSEASIYGGRWNGSSWQLLSAANTTGHTISGTVSSLGDFTGGEVGAVPVELVAFSASVLAESRIRLRWKTATELNCYGFEVQRRGNEQDEAWTALAVVEGQGTKYTPSEYEFIDSPSRNAQDEGTLYYRLRQIDRDGSESYSSIVKVQLGAQPSTAALGAVYPNPSAGAASIEVRVAEAGPVTLTLHNTLGAEVARICDGAILDAGVHVFTLHPGALPSGMYHLTLTQGDVREHRIFILRK